MNVIIVDDEPLAREVMETYLSHYPDLKLIAQCSNAIEAFEVLSKNKIDLMFLDIQMPQISGIDFLKTLSNPPSVIFTTAYPNYALEGYELNIVDYLLKPISTERFAKALDKFFKLSAGNIEKIKETDEEDKPDYIFVKADKKLIKIKYDDIFFIEGLKDYVMLHTPSGRIVTLQTMKSLEKKLPSEIFLRAHRSFIVNLERIEQMEANALYVNKKRIPIGKNYRDELLNVINKNRL